MMSSLLRNGLRLISILAVLGFGFCIFWRYYGVPSQWKDPSLRGRTAVQIYEKLGEPTATSLVKGFDQWRMNGFPNWVLVIGYSEINPKLNRLDPNNFRAEDARIIRVNDIYITTIVERYVLW